MQENPNLSQNEIFLKYFDISDVLIHDYTNKKASNLDRHFAEIEQFLAFQPQNISDNKPLVILSDECFGRKTLLIKWIEFHQRNNRTNYPIQDIILPFFSTVSEKNSNCFYAIYRFLVQLREKLNVKQKVELLEDKLRKYFGYWLDVCARKINKKVIKQKISKDSQIILVIDRVDKFIDASLAKEANIAFWLPRTLPDKVKVIVTCDKESESYSYFVKNNAKFLEIPTNIEISSFLVQSNEETPGFVDGDVRAKVMEIYRDLDENLKKNCKFVQTFLNCLLPVPSKLVEKLARKDLLELNQILKALDYAKLSKINSYDELLDFLLATYETKLMPLEKFQKLFIALCISYKGLTAQEIMLLVKIKEDEWQLFITIFQALIIEYQRLFCIFNCSLKQKIFRRYSKDGEYTNNLHNEISEILEKSSISIRKLEEQTFHLYTAKSFFKLKETVSIIENFLLLFNPNNKFDLCHYWQTLLDNGFDPALEYNKSIEGFEMHYKPSFEDIFRIILQVSRFLKEFADFETENTPIFRHPPIIGSSELEEIGLINEIKAVSMFKYPDLKRTHSILTNLEGKNIAKEESYEEFRQYYIKKIRDKMLSEQMFGNETDEHATNFEQNLGSLKSFKALAEKKSMDFNETASSSSEDEFVHDDMSEYRKMRDSLTKSTQKDRKDAEKGPNPQGKEPSHENFEEIPAYYYYKRWIWMIFPWACLSQDRKCNYSSQILKSYSSATKYISVLEENKYTKRALKIALEAKLKKKMIYGKKEEIDAEMHTLKNMKKEMQMLEKTEKAAQIEPEDALPPRNSKKKTYKLAPLKETSQVSNDKAGNSKKPAQNRGVSSFFLTQDAAVKGNFESTSRFGRSFLKEKFSVYNEGPKLLSTLAIEERSLRILPKLKESISEHNRGALKVLEFDVKSLKNEYDSLLYSNKTLEKKLKEMQFVESNNNLFGTEKEELNLGLLQGKSRALDAKLRENVESFEDTQQQKERIHTILNVCKRNRMQNEEYIRSLNYLLSNFKRCIRKERENIVRNRLKIKSIRTLSENLIGIVGENLANHSKLVSQIKDNLNNKLKFDASFSETEKKMLNSSQFLNEKPDLSAQNDVARKKIVLKSQRTLNISSELEILREEHEKLLNLFGLEPEDDIFSCKKFSDFKYFLEERNQILQQNLEKKDKIDALGEILQAKRAHLENLHRNVENQAENSKLSDFSKNDSSKHSEELEREYEIKARDFSALKQSELNSLMIINTLLTKAKQPAEVFKIRDFDATSLVANLLDKMEFIRNHVSEEEFNDFKRMKVAARLFSNLPLDVEVNTQNSLKFEEE